MAVAENKPPKPIESRVQRNIKLDIAFPPNVELSINRLVLRTDLVYSRRGSNPSATVKKSNSDVDMEKTAQAIMQAANMIVVAWIVLIEDLSKEDPISEWSTSASQIKAGATGCRVLWNERGRLQIPESNHGELGLLLRIIAEDELILWGAVTLSSLANAIKPSTASARTEPKTANFWTSQEIKVSLFPPPIQYPLPQIQDGKEHPFQALINVFDVSGTSSKPQDEKPLHDVAQNRVPSRQIASRSSLRHRTGLSRLGEVKEAEEERSTLGDEHSVDTRDEQDAIRDLLEDSLEDRKDDDGYWIHKDLGAPSGHTFRPGDGFDVYIDGIRFLPDMSTITRVVMQLVTEEFELIGQQQTSYPNMDGQRFNPEFNFRQEYREDSFNPTSTLLFRIETIDEYSKRPQVIGYSVFNAFVVSGAKDRLAQPRTPRQQEFLLNEGNFQLPIRYGKPIIEGFSTTSLDSFPCVSCCTLLIRISAAPKSLDGLETLSTSTTPEKDWQRLGLVKPRPLYQDGLFFKSILLSLFFLSSSFFLLCYSIRLLVFFPINYCLFVINQFSHTLFKKKNMFYCLFVFTLYCRPI